MHHRLTIAGTVLTVLFAAAAAGCSCNDTMDSGSLVDAGECDGECVAGEACRFDVCVPTPEPCTDNSECPGDKYCDTAAGECLPWGVGPGGNSDEACTREIAPGVFFPDVPCEWLGPPTGDPYPAHVNVLGAPMVVDFGLASDSEISRPSIVFISYNCDDGGVQSCVGEDPLCTGVIRVVDGRTCEQLANIDTPLPISSQSVALGDLDGDGTAEIVAATVGGAVAAWTLNAGAFELSWQSLDTSNAGLCYWAGPSIHDLDDDGVPEVLLGGVVYDNQGALLDNALGTLVVGAATGTFPVVADIDADGGLELVAGTAVYGWDGGNTQWVQEQLLAPAGGNVAVADLGTFPLDPLGDDRATLDGEAEVVAITITGEVNVTNRFGRVLFNRPLGSGAAGGPPTIADFDGDGRAEFATAGASAYAVYDLDCQGVPSADTCASLSTDAVLWTQPSQDLSSARTGSSVFDFEGDGIAEVVYGDECFTRVYDGGTGAVLYSRYRTSCTWYENPIVADTDADFAAEIVITSNQNCNVVCPTVDPIFDGVQCFDESDCPGTTSCVREAAADDVGRCRCTADADCGGDGFVCLDPIAGPSPMGQVCRASHAGSGTALGIRVIGDQLGRWVDTRRIWNQHAYAVTGVGDTGSIPRSSNVARNWDAPELNNFRQNAPGFGAGEGVGIMPDISLRTPKFVCLGAATAELSFEVCNRGTEPVGDGLLSAARDGATLACVAQSTRSLFPGECESVSCTWTTAPASGGATVTVTADDDGMGGQLHTECRENNNELSIPDVVCP